MTPLNEQHVHILYLNHNVAGSGTYQRASHVAAAAAQRGHDAVLVTTRRSGRLRALQRDLNGVHVIEAPDMLSGRARNGWDPWNVLWRIARLRSQRFDIVHAFDCRPVVIGPALVQCRRNQASFFLDWSDWWGRGGAISERPGRASRLLLGGIETWLEENFRPRARANTVISEPLRRRCMSLGVPQQQILAFPNGCAPPPLNPLSRQQARAQLGIAEAVKIVLHLGVLYPGDARLLFDAFRVLAGSMPQARLALVGEPGVAVPDDLVALVHRPGFTAPEVLEAWLRAADLGVIPLRDNVANHARWPGKVNEYLSAALPVLMTDVGAAADWIRSSSSGSVCEPDSDTIAHRASQMLSDPEARSRMSAAAAALAAGELSWDRVLAPLFPFYEEWS